MFYDESASRKMSKTPGTQVPKDNLGILQRLYNHEIKGIFKDESFSPSEYLQSHQKTRYCLVNLWQQVQEGKYPFLQSPFWKGDIEDHVQKTADRYLRSCKQILVLGNGSSALGGKSFYELSKPWRRDNSVAPICELHFCDNLDPQIFWPLLLSLNPQQTGALVISKAGETPETLIQLMRCVEHWERCLSQEQLAGRITIITDPSPSALNTIGEKLKCTVLPHPSNIEGRFACFTLVGLLPAILGGLDARKIRQGAAYVVSSVFSERSSAPPIEGASLLWHLAQNFTISNHVFMGYGENFSCLGQWFRQLIAESLGKEGKGFIPHIVMEPKDHHGQLQLYLDGPKDKIFTIVMEKRKIRDRLNPTFWKDIPDLKVWAHSSMSDLMHAQFIAASQVLAKSGRPFRVISTPQLTEITLGALMMHFIIETILLGALSNIDPLGPPPLDKGQAMAYQLLEEHVQAFFD